MLTHPVTVSFGFAAVFIVLFLALFLHLLMSLLVKKRRVPTLEEVRAILAEAEEDAPKLSFNPPGNPGGQYTDKQRMNSAFEQRDYWKAMFISWVKRGL